MKPITEAVESMIAILGLDDDAVAARKAFLGFSETDIDHLRKLHEALQGLGPEFARSFYDHILRFPETRRLIPDDQTLDRLKQTQAEYFDSLTAGEYGPDYIRNRLRVGIAHQRIGLETSWYLGAYAKYLVDMLPEIWQRMGKQPERFIATIQSLLRIVLLDMGLAIDTYIHADRQAILALREYAELVFSAIPDGLVVLAADFTVLSANRAFLKRFGLTEAEVHSRPVLEIITADGLKERLAEVHASGVAQHDLPLAMGPTAGALRTPVRVTITGIHLAEEEEEEEARLLMIVEDMTEQARLQQALQESEATLLRAQTVAHIGSWRLDFGAGKLAWTPEVFRIFGLPEDTPLSYETFLSCVHPEDREMVDAVWQATLMAGETYHVQHRILVEGNTRWVEERAKIEFDDHRRPHKAVGTVQDITERKAAETRIEYLAFYDPLTGLPNRALFMDRLKHELTAAERRNQRLALLFLDLDRFKEINDTQGHDAGDRVLVEVARRFREALRQEETLARLSGDEFVVIASTSDQAAARIADRITSALATPIHINAQGFIVTASIGIAIYPEDGRSPEDILKHADIAMYRAKAAGGGDYRFYRAEMGADLARKLEIVHRLETALAAGRLQLHYQPQVHLPSGRVMGAEALARWHDPEWGTMSPAEFIPIAEERGLISTLGEWALACACRQARGWQERGCPLPGRIAVNVAARQFEDDDLVDRMVRIVAENGAAPAHIELELTESGMMRDPERAIEITRALASAGFTLSIDDFGTGYSSLAYLKRFAAHKLKIDISFVRDMLNDRNDYAIVSTIIAMGRNMELETLAEGVEHAAQASALQALGCHLAQGYHFGRPEAADDFERMWLRGS